MNFFDRLTNGWMVAKTSMKVLNVNRQLLIFPMLSGISMLLIFGSFIAVLLPESRFNVQLTRDMSNTAYYAMVFCYYLVNYFVVVFFNMALIHCTQLYFDGEEVTVGKGLSFSASRIGVILSWSVFAATVGMVLKVLQDNAGWLGKILIGLVGYAWSIATFFVVPVIAYEKVGPFDALERSARMMKEKWGESLGANFSFGLLNLVTILVFGILGAAISVLVNEALGIIIFAGGVLLMITITSALNSIFVSAVYNQINGNLDDHFDQQMLDGLFESK